jgi:glycosyltransferase involved in cell wall biosynthesis
MDNCLNDGGMLATFFLITYNQEHYVREAIEGAFSQTYRPLEIVISDDCSTDGTFRIIEEMTEKYSGPHKLVVNRNLDNLGLIGHINMITSLSSGELIIYAAGDDISLPHRTEKLVERYLASGRSSSLLHSSVYLIDISGNRVGTRLPPVISGCMDLGAMAVSGALIIGATTAFTRKIEDTFGPIHFSKCIEDLVMGFRSALTGGLEYIPDPLILYRHESGITARSDIGNQTYGHWMKRELLNKEIFLAVLAQRIEDLKRIGRVDFIPVLKSKRTEELLIRRVWARNYSMVKLLSYSVKRGLARVFLRSVIRAKKKQIFFPLKKLLHKMRIAS